MTDHIAPVATQEADWHTDPNLSEKWKFRFGFFEKYGVLGAGKSFAGMQVSPEAKQALKEMSFWGRIKVNMNFFALCFGFIYYVFFLRLWRQGLILISFLLVYAIVASILGIPDSFDRGVSIAYAGFCGMRANILYYLKRTRGDIGWMI